MLVKLSDQKPHRTWVTILFFLLITIAPWIVMIWLLWPFKRR